MRELAEQARVCQAIPFLWLGVIRIFRWWRRAQSPGREQLQWSVLGWWHLGYPRAELRVVPALH